MRERTRTEVVKAVQPHLDEAMEQAVEEAVVRASNQLITELGGQTPVIIQNLTITVVAPMASGGGATNNVALGTQNTVEHTRR